MPGLVLAISGALGSGKSNLTRALHDRLHWRRVSFGDQVRKVAEDASKDRNDRSILQQLGQFLVLTDPQQFVRDVLDQGLAQPNPNSTAENLIVDGVRHVEILLELRKQVVPRAVRLVYLKTDIETRQVRLVQRDHVERRIAARYDSDISEAQVARILPQYADLTLDGSLPTSLLIERVVSFVTQTNNPLQAANG